MNESKMGRNVVDGGRSTKNLGNLETGYIHSGGDLGNHPLELEMNVKWDGTITLRVTQWVHFVLGVWIVTGTQACR